MRRVGTFAFIAALCLLVAWLAVGAVIQLMEIRHPGPLGVLLQLAVALGGLALGWYLLGQLLLAPFRLLERLLESRAIRQVEREMAARRKG